MNGPDPDDVWREVEKWVEHAEADRSVVAVCLAAAPPLLEAASFHCQQAAEKLLKAALVWAAIPFRKTHDLALLGTKVVGAYPDFADIAAMVEPWTSWSTSYRYPGDDASDPPPSPETLTAALGLIDHLATKVRGLRDAAPMGTLDA